MSGPLRQQHTLLHRRVSSLCLARHSRDTVCHSHSKPGELQRRFLFESIFGRRSKSQPKSASGAGQNPFLQDILSRKPAPRAAQPPARKGDLSAGSVFSSDADLKAPSEPQVEHTKVLHGERRNVETINVVMDPNPRRRELWQREMVTRLVRRKERLTKSQFVKRTEREVVVKSPNFKTSVKKLGALARQISGKSVEDALVQMRFSKKLAARDVKAHLEYARDTAIVSRGMGLGSAAAETKQDGEQAAPASAAIDIQRKDGRRHKVTDLSKLYVDQAWVGRGTYGKEPDFRARGQVYILRPPHTHITVKLKEESTLVREWKDREDKKRRQRLEKPWTPLPDRPIQGQHQYYTW